MAWINSYIPKYIYLYKHLHDFVESVCCTHIFFSILNQYIDNLRSINQKPKKKSINCPQKMRVIRMKRLRLQVTPMNNWKLWLIHLWHRWTSIPMVKWILPNIVRHTWSSYKSHKHWVRYCNRHTQPRKPQHTPIDSFFSYLCYSYTKIYTSIHKYIQKTLYINGNGISLHHDDGYCNYFLDYGYC